MPFGHECFLMSLVSHRRGLEIPYKPEVTWRFQDFCAPERLLIVPGAAVRIAAHRLLMLAVRRRSRRFGGVILAGSEDLVEAKEREYQEGDEGDPKQVHVPTGLRCNCVHGEPPSQVYTQTSLMC